MKLTRKTPTDGFEELQTISTKRQNDRIGYLQFLYKRRGAG